MAAFIAPTPLHLRPAIASVVGTTLRRRRPRFAQPHPLPRALLTTEPDSQSSSSPKSSRNRSSLFPPPRPSPTASPPAPSASPPPPSISTSAHPSPSLAAAAAAASDPLPSSSHNRTASDISASSASVSSTPPTKPSLTSPPPPPDYDGPPLEYDRDALQAYWKTRSSELNARYLKFATTTAPFITRIIRHVATGTLGNETVIGSLAATARENLVELGPTFVKIGQVGSSRPDLIPEAARLELQKLQDSVEQFDSDVARQVVSEDLAAAGLGSLDSVYSEFSVEPIAAASLAQVYRARLRKSGVEVAVKVQRPEALSTCSKDLYVLGKAVVVYQGFMSRWTAQKVDYEALLENFASGFYRELDFVNEARNQISARERMLKTMRGKVYVPKVFERYTSRRVLVSEFVYGQKLTEVGSVEMRRLLEVGQECFLQQLLDDGAFLHGDPHGGNLLKPDSEATAIAVAEAEAAKLDGGDESDEEWDDLLPSQGIEPDLYLLDWGLVSFFPDEDKPKLVLAIVHMANKDWALVTEDFVELGFLPKDVDRKQVSPVLEKVLAPYVLDGGGAKAFLGDGVFSASFQDLARDLSLAAVQIPFEIPAYYASATRAIAILEGLALIGDPDYKIVLSAYPFVTRKLLQDGGDSESLRTALNEILYPRSPDGRQQTRPSARRVLALLNNALGRAASASDSSGTLDLDAVPDNAASLSEAVSFLNKPEATAIRTILVDELVSGADLVLRSLTRRLALSLQGDMSISLPFPNIPFLPKPRVPVLNLFTFIPESLRDSTVDRVAPALSDEEAIFVGDIGELSKSVLGLDLQDLVLSVTSPAKLASLVGLFASSALQRSLIRSDDSADDSGDSRSLRQEFFALLPRPGGGAQTEAQVAAESIGSEVFGRLRATQETRLGLSSASKSEE